MPCVMVLAVAAAGTAAVVLDDGGGYGGGAGGNSFHAAGAGYNQSKTRRLYSATIIQKKSINQWSEYRNERHVYIVSLII